MRDDEPRPVWMSLPSFVGSDSWGQIFCQLSETEREHEEEGRAGGRGAQLRYARGSRASRVCARTSTYPRTGIPAGPVRTLAWLQGRCAPALQARCPAILVRSSSC
jgi:hypothetical protein